MKRCVHTIIELLQATICLKIATHSSSLLVNLYQIRAESNEKVKNFMTLGFRTIHPLFMGKRECAKLLSEQSYVPGTHNNGTHIFACLICRISKCKCCILSIHMYSLFPRLLLFSNQDIVEKILGPPPPYFLEN